MTRLILAVLAIAVAGPLAASTAKQTDCGFQADVVAAVQAARLARVGERKVADHINASEPEWPDRYDAVVPLVTPWVYQMKMRDVRSADLGAAWKEACLQQ